MSKRADISAILVACSAILLVGCDREPQPEDCVAQFSDQFTGEDKAVTRAVAATFGFQMTDGLQDWMVDGIDGITPTGMATLGGGDTRAEDIFLKEMSNRDRPRAIMLLSDPAHYVHAPEPFTSSREALRTLSRFCNMTDKGLRLRSVTTSYNTPMQDQ